MIIGLCGKSGSGKSICAGVLHDFGYLIIDADKISKDVYYYEDVQKELRKAFSDICIDGVVDRAMLLKLVLSDKTSLDMLNSIMHPIILNEINEQIEKNKGKDIVLDVPLLFECGLDKMCDKTVEIIAPEHIRVKRIMNRDSKDEKTAKLQAGLQKSGYDTDEKIINDGNVSDLKKEILKIVGKYK